MGSKANGEEYFDFKSTQKVYTAIQGIDSGKHRLELYGKSLREIKETRVFKPTLSK